MAEYMHAALAAFEDALDAYRSWDDGEPEPAVEINGESTTIGRLCGLLWNCRTPVPRRLVPELRDLQHCSQPAFGAPPTYAVAARLLKSRIVEA